ncbi:MAG: hypothetical protein EA424_18660 [Planctomycetaceae bacterium]|nr:MAG: hypothetical protein EA424_18660 [Planctomycetaceae bacterium]
MIHRFIIGAFVIAGTMLAGKITAHERPNIVFIIADDLGYSDLGCYGGEIDTPRLDRLAREGLRFRQFYNQAKCEPTRAALMTGLYHPRAGLALQNPSVTLGEALRAAGYRTGIVGKWHLPRNPTRKEQTPIERGFDHFYGLYDGASDYFPSAIGRNKVSLDAYTPGNFITPLDHAHFRPHDRWGHGPDAQRFLLQSTFPEDYYMTDAFGDHAVALIEDAVADPSGAPFFLYLSFNAPHTPLQAPTPLIDKYRDLYRRGWDVLREEKWTRLQANGLIEPPWRLPPWRDDVPPWHELTTVQQEKEAHRRAVYAAMVDSMDQNIGKVLDALDRLDRTKHPGLSDNTLVMFMSDNGAQAFDNANPPNRQVDPSHPDSRWCMGAVWSAFSNMPFRYNKQSQHQGGHCSPLIARWPAVIAPATITDQPGHIIDIMATFVDIGDVDYDALDVPPLDGASLRPILEGGHRPPPDFWGFEFGGMDLAVIQGEWKLVNFRSGPWRLFNLREDRTEMRNLAWQHPERVRSMAALYDQWSQDTFGNDQRIFAQRRTRDRLGPQHMRYTEVLESNRLGFYANPPIGVTAAGIGDAPGAAVREIHEIWTLRASGTGMAATGRDAFTFVGKPFSGDGEIITLVEAVKPSGKVRLGVMFRATLEPDSPFVMTGLNPGPGRTLQIVRDRPGADSKVTRGEDGVLAPFFLRLARHGDKFTASYASADSYVWKDFATTTVTLPAEGWAGLAASSGTASETVEVIFREWENMVTER